MFSNLTFTNPNVVPILKKIEDIKCPFHYKKQIASKPLSIYAIKFNPFDADDIFAAAVGNLIKVYRIDDTKTMRELGSFELVKGEIIYSLDWSLTGSNDYLLVAGGKKGVVYDVCNKVDLISRNLQTINEIKFSRGNKSILAIASAGNLIYYK